MTKTAPRTLPGLLRVQGSKGCGRSRECGAYGVKGPGCGGLWVWGLSRVCVCLGGGVMRSRGCGYMGVGVGCSFTVQTYVTQYGVLLELEVPFDRPVAKTF